MKEANAMYQREKKQLESNWHVMWQLFVSILFEVPGDKIQQMS